MEQGSPPPNVTSSSTATKRRRMSIVDESNILSDPHRKRKRAAVMDPTYTPHDESGVGSPSAAGGGGGGAGAGGPSTMTMSAAVPARSPEEFEQVKQMATILYDKLMAQRDPNNYDRFLHEHFVELPDPNLIPGYYDKIKKPVCLSQIKQRLETLAYGSLLEAKTDMNQIFVNAKRFNAPGSPLFMDAKKLHKNLRANYAYLIGEAPPPEEDEPPRRHRRGSSSVPAGGAGGGGDDGDYVDSGGNASTGGNNQKRGPTLKPWLLKKYDQLVRKTDPNGRVYADVFKALPDKRAWPEYYQYITHPISLDNILAKANARKYRSVQEFNTDVETSFNNAMFFNEEGSQIWNDAKTMLDHFGEIMQEVPPKFAPPRKYNTARRRAELEHAQAERLARGEYGDARTNQQDEGEGGADGADASQDEGDSDDAEEESDNGGGDYPVGFDVNVLDATMGSSAIPVPGLIGGHGFPNPLYPTGIAPAAQPAIPGLVIDDVSAQSINLVAAQHLLQQQQQQLQQAPPETASSLEALTSLANLASSLSPQRAPALNLPSVPLASAMQAQPQLLQHRVASSMSAGARIGSATDGPFSPKPLAKVPSPDEIPLVTSFAVMTSTPTAETSALYSLANAQARQHALSVSPATNKVEFTLSIRRERLDIGVLSSAAANGGASPQGEEGQAVPVEIEISSRRAEAFSPVVAAATGGQSGSDRSTRFAFVPKRGLNVAEFNVKPSHGGGPDEVYRIFISK
ncbi:hypothetical protein JCM3766R1_003151 [Sporobolomyces carnicolor]